MLHLSGLVIQAMDSYRTTLTSVTLRDVTAQVDLRHDYQRVKVAALV